MTNLEYLYSLIGIVVGCLAMGFAICWPIAHAIGYRRAMQQIRDNIDRGWRYEAKFARDSALVPRHSAGGRI